MERWSGKVAVVTGASSGIGAAIVIDLVKAGMIVVGLARRKDRVEALKKDIPSNATGKLYAVKCDITRDDDIVKAFGWIVFELGGIDVLVNNAGIVKMIPLLEEGNEDSLKSVLQTNLWGLVLCTKKAVEIMRRKKTVGGHIININSIAGHKVIGSFGRQPVSNVYPCSKFGVTALTEVLRQEFAFENMKMKVTSISPGFVKTEILPAEVFAAFPYPSLNADDISEAVIFALGTPPHVQIHELIIKPVGEVF
ncbi:farnesol dehydrogenase-like [Bradysia coprophila]|uniref:farnesol dehydrogenase-like n=1 Tax=Bradysia coprophila TaxID=38358 RepID=UPI00187DDA6E|nr:farnesol dehydrogenase-like [Bradysia coprophila]